MDRLVVTQSENVVLDLACKHRTWNGDSENFKACTHIVHSCGSQTFSITEYVHLLLGTDMLKKRTRARGVYFLSEREFPEKARMIDSGVEDPSASMSGSSSSAPQPARMSAGGNMAISMADGPECCCEFVVLSPRISNWDIQKKLGRSIRLPMYSAMSEYE
ncbi:hypothetical protein DFH29DRAFT_874156 [Suillus ampliporus]|nr:hypothetical protein DFH29DRAFT_874156 [Suillus ampliporus]